MNTQVSWWIFHSLWWISKYLITFLNRCHRKVIPPLSTNIGEAMMDRSSERYLAAQDQFRFFLLHLSPTGYITVYPSPLGITSVHRERRGCWPVVRWLWGCRRVGGRVGYSRVKEVGLPSSSCNALFVLASQPCNESSRDTRRPYVTPDQR